MTKKELDAVKLAWKKTIKSNMIDRLLPIHKACADIKLTTFLEALNEDEELYEDYKLTKIILRDMMIQETIQVYHSEQGPWAAKNIKLKVDAISKIIEIMDKNNGDNSTEVVITYED